MADLGDSTWSPIDASNDSMPPAGWPEGMFPSDVNNSARAQMGGEKRWWQRSNSTQTTTGTSTAYVLTYPAAETALYDGEETSFIMDQTCGAAPTLNRDALGAYPLRKYINGAYTAIAANDLTAGQVIRVRYNAEGGTPTYDIVNASGTGANLNAGIGPNNLVQLDNSGALPNLPGIFQTGMRIGFTFPPGACPTGWIVAIGTIGNTSSNATNRANADTQNLFTGYYNGGTDATHPLLTSAGAATTRAAQGVASAAFASNCQMTVPNYTDRFAIGVGGTLAPTIGVTGGATTQTLIAANLPPHAHGQAGPPTTLGGSGGGSSINGSPGSGNTDNGPGTSTPFSIVNPFIGETQIIKL